jgi:dienelactone hydrolase
MADIRVPAADAILLADVDIPAPAHGVVIFAHGSGSGRRSPRNRLVANRLQDAGLATILLDLLTDEEERADATNGALRFNISLLGRRVVDVIDWVLEQEALAGLPVGMFGASTGAAAALMAAAIRPDTVRAVVSRGGRPDLAGPHLRAVRAPTLLIIGGLDRVVIDLNRAAMHVLARDTRLEIIPGAGHLFAEPGALQRVADLAAGWFDRHLRTAVLRS